MCEILREYAKNENHKRYDRNIKIPAVVPLVLYNGLEKWNVPNEFRKMIYNENLFGKGILNFKYDVFDINNDYTKEELLESKNVTSAIFLLDQKIDALEFLQRIKVIALFFDGLWDEEMKALKHWIRNTTPEQLSESAIKILESSKEDVESMVANNAFILDEWKEKAKKQGVQEGIEQGMEQGILLSKKEDIIELLKDIGEVKLEIREKIYDISDIQKLKCILKIAAKSSSIEEFILHFNSCIK